MRKGQYSIFSKYNLLLLIIFIALAGIAGRRVYGLINHLANDNNSVSDLKDKPSSKKHGSANLTIVINRLPKIVSETSGLIFYSGGLWTHNDSGGLPEIYKFDTITGKVEQTITVENAVNTDWEDIAQDRNFIYIGDFGNNSGTRRDLKIYRIAKNQIPRVGDASLNAKLICFSYSDQSNFSFALNKNNYDCEAMISSGDSLYLFSKRWLDRNSIMYVLPKTPGTWVAQKRDSLDARGLITGADISHALNEVSLIGYSKSTPFIWILYGYTGADFLKGFKQRIKFPGQTGAQTEGIAYAHGRKLFISSEKTLICPQRLYKFNTSPWTKPTSRGWKETGQVSGCGALPDSPDFSSELAETAFSRLGNTIL